VRERLVASPRALESLTRYLKEARALLDGEVGPRFDEERLLALPLPRDLEGLVAERLRSMPESERDLLEKAAACGETFWLDAVVALVRAVALEDGDPDGPTLGEVAAAGDRTRGEVATALRDLVHRGLLVEQPDGMSSIGSEREFCYAASPWWEVVYEGIPDDRRRRYHRVIAQWLELRPRGRGEEEQEEIGRHLERAGDGEGAALRYTRNATGSRAAKTERKTSCVGVSCGSSKMPLSHCALASPHASIASASSDPQTIAISAMTTTETSGYRMPCARRGSGSDDNASRKNTSAASSLACSIRCASVRRAMAHSPGRARAQREGSIMLAAATQVRPLRTR